MLKRLFSIADFSVTSRGHLKGSPLGPLLAWSTAQQAIPRWWWLYDAALALAAPFWLPYYALVRRPGHPGLLQRFGVYPPELRASWAGPGPSVWVHAVSVGETLAALPLLAALRARCPGRRWVVSTTTPTGQRLARERLPADTTVFYVPWDLTPCVRRAIAVVRPRLFLALETELWPNLLLRLGAAGVPIAVVNGRLSARSFPRYRAVRRWLAPALEPVKVWAMQTAADAERVLALGVPPSRVQVLGNLKADVVPPACSTEQRAALRTQLGLTDSSPLWVAGSTHPGEEEIVLGAWRQVRVDYPTLCLLLAPRHPARVPEVERLVGQFGATPRRWSQVRAAGASGRHSQPPPPGPHDVMILDTLGELMPLYGLADLVLVGGSMVPHGGHNVLEPAQWAKPVLAGPHTGNFQSLVELLSAAGGLRVVENAEMLAAQVREWLAHPERRRQAGEAARAAVAAQAGATTRTVQVLCEQFGDVLLADDA